MALLLDLHTHSKYSDDSQLEPAETVRLAKQRGFNGVAVTDHLSARGGVEARDANSDPRFIVIPGIEYPTEAGHVVGLFVDREIGLHDLRAAGGLYPLKDVASAIHGAGGVAVLAHPFEHRKRLTEGLFGSGSGGPRASLALDALEGFNARACASRNRLANRQAAEYARSHGIPVTGGSDAHFAREVGRAGCRIEGLEPGASLEDVKQAILRGQATAFGEDSPRTVVPLTQLFKLRKAGRLGGMPKAMAKLALAAIDPLGLWIENLLLPPDEE